MNFRVYLRALEPEDYLITYAFGHLFTLYNVEQYLPDYDKEKKYRWTLDNLPFYPEKFRPLWALSVLI